MITVPAGRPPETMPLPGGMQVRPPDRGCCRLAAVGGQQPASWPPNRRRCLKSVRVIPSVRAALWWLTAERLPARPFTDPERTLADATVMDRMLRRLRRQARSWPSWRTSAEMLTHTRGGLALHADHHWITGCPPSG